MVETRIDVRYAEGDDVRDVMRRGIELCQANQWRDGVANLAAIASQKEIELPAAYYGYLGYGLIRTERQAKEGIALCKKAVKLGYADADNHFNLARSYWLLKKRDMAVDALESGMRLDHRHAGLRELRDEMGYRRPPVIRFLSRDNFFNRLLGRRRHDRIERDGY